MLPANGWFFFGWWSVPILSAFAPFSNWKFVGKANTSKILYHLTQVVIFWNEWRIKRSFLKVKVIGRSSERKSFLIKKGKQNWENHWWHRQTAVEKHSRIGKCSSQSEIHGGLKYSIAIVVGVTSTEGFQVDVNRLQCCSTWPGGVVVRALDLWLWKLRVWLPFSCFQVRTSGKLFMHVPLSPSSIIWYRSRGSLMPCSWEGYCRVWHRTGYVSDLWFIHLQAQGLRKGDEHSAYTPHFIFNVVMNMCGYCRDVCWHISRHGWHHIVRHWKDTQWHVMQNIATRLQMQTISLAMLVLRTFVVVYCQYRGLMFVPCKHWMDVIAAADISCIPSAGIALSFEMCQTDNMCIT